MSYKLLAICGSLRRDSFNKKLVEALIELAPERVTIETADIGHLPLFNQDLEEKFPPEAAKLKERIRAVDGIIICTPEYNRSVPGVLKNMVDWTSRPYGDNAWAKKSVGTMGVSIGTIGTAVAQYHLKHIMNYLDAHVMGQPEFYGNAQIMFDQSGKLTERSSREHIVKFLDAFLKHIEGVRT